MKSTTLFSIFCIVMILPVTAFADLSTSSVELQAYDPSDFVSRWNTILVSSGSSTSFQIKLPLPSSGTYDFTVDWGDSSTDSITSYNQAEVTHTYASEGEYTLAIIGSLIGWQFNNGGDKLKIIEISQWGDINLGNDGSYFYGCTNLILTATDAPDLSGTTSLYRAFRDCDNLGSTGSMDAWVLSSVTDTRYLFYGASYFNQDISSWNVSSVTDMDGMFYNVTLSNKNYDDILIEWANLSLQSGVNFDGGNSKHTIAASAARQYIIDTFGWSIIDGGLVEITSPDISNPADVSYELGTTGNQVAWIVGDKNPDMYNVTVDGILNTTDTWANGTITIDIDGLAVGIYTVIINVYDTHGNMISDTVLVTVTENTVDSSDPTSDTSDTNEDTSSNTGTDTNTTETPINALIYIFTLATAVFFKRKRT